MSKWRKALKNKRKFDARYFLNERVENQEVVENSVQQEEVKKRPAPFWEQAAHTSVTKP